MNAAFVAEARRVYVPAAKWMRANGWRNNLRNEGLRLSLDWSLGRKGVTFDGSRIPFVNVMRRTEYNTFLGNKLLAEVASLTEAIDYLVVAGILPEEFASGGRYEPAVDFERDSIWLAPDEEIAYGDGDEDLTDVGCTRLYRRVPAAEVTS